MIEKSSFFKKLHFKNTGMYGKVKWGKLKRTVHIKTVVWPVHYKVRSGHSYIDL